MDAQRTETLRAPRSGALAAVVRAARLHRVGSAVLGEDVELGRRVRVAGSGVVIGDGCRIGDDVLVLAGVRIGAGCVVEAGSTVARDCPPGGRYAGSPATRREELLPRSAPQRAGRRRRAARVAPVASADAPAQVA